MQNLRKHFNDVNTPEEFIRAQKVFKSPFKSKYSPNTKQLPNSRSQLKSKTELLISGGNNFNNISSNGANLKREFLLYNNNLNANQPSNSIIKMG